VQELSNIFHNFSIYLSLTAGLQHIVAQLGQGTQLPAVVRFVPGVQWRLLDACIGIWLGQRLRVVQRIITGSCVLSGRLLSGGRLLCSVCM
jgi:hypothetical protein